MELKVKVQAKHINAHAQYQLLYRSEMTKKEIEEST